MTSNTISIVTPSYNQAAFIEDALVSVERQTHPAVEHIVVDGGSTDGTVDVLRHYADIEGYDLSWTSEPDRGQSDAINKGFERVSGDIVAWLNSDDAYFDVDALSRVSSYFDRFEAEVIYGDLAYLDTDSTVTAIDVRPDFDRRKLPYRILVGQPATFFRRTVVEEERLDTALDYGMDYEYWLRLAQHFTFRHVDDVLAGFRSYDEQKSQDREAMSAELRGVLENYEFPHRGLPSLLLDNAAIEVRRLGAAIVVTYRLHRNSPELAFDGRLASLPRMLLNVGPDVGDARKVIRRLRSKGATG